MFSFDSQIQTSSTRGASQTSLKSCPHCMHLCRYSPQIVSLTQVPQGQKQLEVDFVSLLYFILYKKEPTCYQQDQRERGIWGKNQLVSHSSFVHVSNSSFNILQNGCNFGFSKCRSGREQDCPLLQLLLILCIEELSVMLKAKYQMDIFCLPSQGMLPKSLIYYC